MRYRMLDANGDYSFGQGSANFLVNSPQCVAQSVKTRLALWEGEWFVDQTEGTPWLQEILGRTQEPIYDLAIRTRILGTQGVSSISKYSSTLLPNRDLNVVTSIVTIYDSEPVVVDTVVTPPAGANGLNFSQAQNMIYVPALIR